MASTRGRTEENAKSLGMTAGEFRKKHRSMKRRLYFSLIEKAGMNICFQCGKPMTYEDYSIEHKVPWLHADNALELFEDLDNLAFSHKSCNSKAARRSTKALKKSHTSSKHGFIGVNHRASSGKYRAVVNVDIGGSRKRRYFGQFATAEEAARLYDKKVVEIYGPNSETNESLGNFK